MSRFLRWSWGVTAAATVRAALHLPLLAVGLLTSRGRRRGRWQRATIALQAYAPWHAVFFAPIVRELRATGNVELVFIVAFQPLFSSADRIALRNFARSVLGFPPGDVRAYWQCMWEPFDVMLYADVFAHFPLRRSVNTLLYHGAGTPARFLERGWLRKHVADFDVVLTAGRHDRDLLLALRPAGRSVEIRDVGCPLMDVALAPRVSRAEYLRNLGLDIGRKTVLYAPHWGLLQHAGGRAEPFVSGVVRALGSLDLNVVIKLHRFSYTKIGSGGVSWARSVAALCGANVAVDHDVDDTAALALSDLLVTDDQSSRALNATLLGKPVILCVPPSEAAWKPRDYWHRLSPILSTAKDFPDLCEQVRAALDDPPGAADERRRVAREFFSYPGEATRETVRVVTELLRRRGGPR